MFVDAYGNAIAIGDILMCKANPDESRELRLDRIQSQGTRPTLAIFVRPDGSVARHTVESLSRATLWIKKEQPCPRRSKCASRR